MGKYDEGAKAEFTVAKMLKNDGWYIANASSLDEVAGDDGAPLVRGEDDNKITPDIHAMKEGRTVWVEVKRKNSGPEYIRKNDQNEHFIDAPNWKQYNEVQAESGLELWLAIVEVPSQTLQRQLIEDISVVGYWSETDVKKYDGDKYGEPGVFVPQHDFLPMDIPPTFAGELFDQQQLSDTATVSESVLPGSDDDGGTEPGQSGLGDFKDGGEADD
jgi:hypothetical protein